MINLKPLALVTLFGTSFFISCSDAEKKEDRDNVTDSVSVKKDSAAAAVVEEDSDVSYNLPSALQIAYVFKKSGSAFEPTLLNDKASSSKYNTSNYKRATNFGVYSADLAYCVFNKKFQESKDYLKACKDMGSTLGLNQAFEGDNMAQRFEKNISNEDSVIKIVGNVQLKTDVLFEQNKQKHITAIAFAGAWIESAYIADQVYAKTKNKKALSSLLEQLWMGKTLVKALTASKAKEVELPSLIEHITKINDAYMSIASIKSAMDKDEDLDFSKTAVTDEEFKTISEAIASLRKTIIE